jgi:hypothetical protein
VYLAPSLFCRSNVRQPATSDQKTIAVARRKIFAARRTVRPDSLEAALVDYRKIIRAIAERRRAMAQLNVRRFAGLGVGYVPKRHADRGQRASLSAPQSRTKDVEREHFARLASAVGRRIMNVMAA